MTDEELTTRLSELNAIRNRLLSQSSAIYGEITALRDERLRRDPSKREVTDHAVVRYLARCAGVDIASVRAAISKLADEAVRVNRRQDEWWHEASGIVLVIKSEDGSVVTILGPDEAEKYIGRRLTDGTKAGATDNGAADSILEGHGIKC